MSILPHFFSLILVGGLLVCAGPAYLPAATSGRLITDGERGSFTGETVTLTPDRKLTVTLKPNGGFDLVLPVQ